jgi:hypothetical protein
MPKLNKIGRYAICRYALKCVSTSIKNALQGNINNFGDFYGRISNLSVSQSQLPQLATLFEFYNSIQYTCGGNNHQNPNTKGGE